MDKIIFLPALAAALISIFFTPKKAFLNVYLPVLILLPQVYRAQIKGFYDLNFAEATLIPLFMITFLRHSFQGWRFTLTDVLVLGYFVSSIYSEYLNTESTVISSLAGRLLLSSVVPYFVARQLINSRATFVTFAQQIVILVVINILLCSYEWRFVENGHTAILSPFFAGQFRWIPSYRFGMVRISGPFPHTILFAIVIGIALLLFSWLRKNKLWEYHPHNLIPFPRGVKKFSVAITLLVGLLLTFSRGPFLGILFGSILIGIGFSKHRWRSLFLRIFLTCAIGLLLLNYLQHIAEKGQGGTSKTIEGSISYRLELVNKYEPYVREKPYFGWGLLAKPEVPGMVSVDNHYLWLTLKHGLITLGLFTGILLVNIASLFIKGMKEAKDDHFSRSLAFTLFSIILTISLSIVTVYLHDHIETLLFLIIGSSQSYLTRKMEDKLAKIPSKRRTTLVAATA